MGSPMAMGSPTSPGSGGLNQSTFLPSYLMGEPSPMVQTVSYVIVYVCFSFDNVPPGPFCECSDFQLHNFHPQTSQPRVRINVMK